MNISVSRPHVFEIKVINSLEHEAILVQVKPDLNFSTTLPYRKPPAPAVPSNPISSLPPVNHNVSNLLNGPFVNQRYLNQQRSFDTLSQSIYSTKTAHAKPIPPIPTIPEIINQPPNALRKQKLDMIDNNYNQQSVYPGFVRLPSFQSLLMPVAAQNKLLFAYITVYVVDAVSNKITCLANQLQINRQSIEIKRAESGNITLQTSSSHSQNQIDTLFFSWSLPSYLCNAMKNNGWDNIALWHEITESDLIDMGFQRGHRLIFFDKFTDLLRNQYGSDLMGSNIKCILKSWNLPIHLFSSMVENGWTDPFDWGEIADHQFKKMGFKDGHVIKFRKHVKNNDHIIQFQKMQSEFAERKFVEKTESKSSEILSEPIIGARLGQFFGNKLPIPTFMINPTTVTHEQFWYRLGKMNPNKKYYLETRNGDKPWQTRDEVTDLKRRNICELDMNTKYFVRIRADNKRNTKVTYSKIAEVQTKDEKWKNIHLPKIPDFKYAVSSNNKQITVEFDPESLQQVKQTKFDERYSLDIGLSKDEGLEKIVNWKNVSTLRKDKLVYKYNVNDQKNADSVHVGISASNDLGQRYNQCTQTRKFPFNQVIKRINTTKHGNNLQFNDAMTVATKIDQDYQYSTFAFGQPITNEMCNRYDMYVKVNKLKSDCFMGYAPSLESVINWNQALGYGPNKMSSVGVLANKSTADFAVYNKDDDKRFIYHAASGRNEKKWDDGSVFVLSFDFLNDDCNIYLNENNATDNNDHNTSDRNRLLKSIKLNQAKSVVPSFSLNYEGDSIEVVKWRLY